MKHLVLTTEQVRIVREASQSVEVRDEQGRIVGSFTPLHPGDLEAIEQSNRSRGAGPRVPSAQVQEHLGRLEEIRQREGMDEPRMLELLRRLRAGEQL